MVILNVGFASDKDQFLILVVDGNRGVRPDCVIRVVQIENDPDAVGSNSTTLSSRLIQVKSIPVNVGKGCKFTPNTERGDIRFEQIYEYL